MKLPPPLAPHTRERDAIERPITAEFRCRRCDAVLATYRLASIRADGDRAVQRTGPILDPGDDEQEDDSYESWQETIGAIVRLAPGLVNRKRKHPSGLPAYGPGNSGFRPETGRKVRLPCVVVCRCGNEARLDVWGDEDLAQAGPDARDELVSERALEGRKAEEREAHEQAMAKLWERLGVSRHEQKP